MERKIFRYFVSYSHTMGFGNVEMLLDNVIDDYNDIKEVQKVLVDSYKAVEPVVISYQLLRIEE